VRSIDVIGQVILLPGEGRLDRRTYSLHHSFVAPGVSLADILATDSPEAAGFSDSR
jgi:hypothetical protein